MIQEFGSQLGSVNQSFSGAGALPGAEEPKQSRRCWVMQGTLTRELLGPLWREEISFGKGSLVLQGIQHVKVGKESRKLFPDCLKF